MQERHHNRQRYFDEQGRVTSKYVIPFIEKSFPLKEGMRVLEIGCGEGGNLVPFLERGLICVGVDLSESKIQVGNELFAEHPLKHQLSLIAQDIYKWEGDSAVEYDVIMMRDVIEHIPDQERFMEYVKKFLKPDGKFFLGFPPWRNPFGGHQQICRSKVLSKMPWVHLWPNFIYRGILKLFGENQVTIQELLEIKSTGINLGRFERILRKRNYKTNEVIFYFLQPNYEIKFGLKPRVQLGFIAKFPFIRDFFVTCGYYLISK